MRKTSMTIRYKREDGAIISEETRYKPGRRPLHIVCIRMNGTIKTIIGRTL